MHQNRRVKQSVVVLDMEAVLVPGIWISVAGKTGIPELRRTTHDEVDYDKLMRGRIAILDQPGLTLSDIQNTIAVETAGERTRFPARVGRRGAPFTNAI